MIVFQCEAEPRSVATRAPSIAEEETSQSSTAEAAAVAPIRHEEENNHGVHTVLERRRGNHGDGHERNYAPSGNYSKC